MRRGESRGRGELVLLSLRRGGLQEEWRVDLGEEEERGEGGEGGVAVLGDKVVVGRRGRADVWRMRFGAPPLLAGVVDLFGVVGAAGGVGTAGVFGAAGGFGGFGPMGATGVWVTGFEGIGALSAPGPREKRVFCAEAGGRACVVRMEGCSGRAGEWKEVGNVFFAGGEAWGIGKEKVGVGGVGVVGGMGGVEGSVALEMEGRRRVSLGPFGVESASRFGNDVSLFCDDEAIRTFRFPPPPAPPPLPNPSSSRIHSFLERMEGMEGMQGMQGMQGMEGMQRKGGTGWTGVAEVGGVAGGGGGGTAVTGKKGGRMGKLRVEWKAEKEAEKHLLSLLFRKGVRKRSAVEGIGKQRLLVSNHKTRSRMDRGMERGMERGIAEWVDFAALSIR